MIDWRIGATFLWIIEALLKIWYSFRYALYQNKDSLKERVLRATKKRRRDRDIQVSRRHVLRKVVRCVKFIFGLDTEAARVQERSIEHEFPLGGISATRVSRAHPERNVRT